MPTEKDRIISELLLVRYQRGDSAALEELIQHWEGRLFYYVRRLVTSEDEAWEALQETWVALLRGIGKLREPPSLVPWLYRTARHKAMDRLRARYDDRAVSLECDEVATMEQGGEEFTFEDAAQVHRALDRISAPHREVLTLFFLEDLKIGEIADLLALPLGTVKSRLHFAKQSLRAVMEGEGVR